MTKSAAVSSAPAASPGTEDCSGCRWAKTSRRPKIMEATGFDDQLMFEDRDEAVYTCGSSTSVHAGQEIGPVPATCGAWEAQVPPEPEKLSELDRLMAASAARAARAVGER